MKVNPHRTQKYNRHKGFHDYGLSAVTDSGRRLKATIHIIPIVLVQT